VTLATAVGENIHFLEKIILTRKIYQNHYIKFNVDIISFFIKFNFLLLNILYSVLINRKLR